MGLDFTFRIIIPEFVLHFVSPPWFPFLIIPFPFCLSFLYRHFVTISLLHFFSSFFISFFFFGFLQTSFLIFSHRMINIFLNYFLKCSYFILFILTFIHYKWSTKKRFEMVSRQKLFSKFEDAEFENDLTFSWSVIILAVQKCFILWRGKKQHFFICFLFIW